MKGRNHRSVSAPRLSQVRGPIQGRKQQCIGNQRGRSRSLSASLGPTVQENGVWETESEVGQSANLGPMVAASRGKTAGDPSKRADSKTGDRCKTASAPSKETNIGSRPSGVISNVKYNFWTLRSIRLTTISSKGWHIIFTTIVTDVARAHGRADRRSSQSPRPYARLMTLVSRRAVRNWARDGFKLVSYSCALGA